MTEFVYNNVKYGSIGYTSFKLNYRYHQRISYEGDIDLYSRSKVANELTNKLKNLMPSYRENLKHTQKLQKKPIMKKPSLEVTLAERNFV